MKGKELEKKPIEKCEEKDRITKCSKKTNGITLIALVITTIFSYDESVKSSNNKGFLLKSI